MAKRELINTGADKRFVRRNSKGQFNESDDVGRSLSADRRRKAKNTAKEGQGDKGDRVGYVQKERESTVRDKSPTDYVWHAKANRSFMARCHIENEKSWISVQFDSDLGPVEHPQGAQGNPIFIVSDGGATLRLRGAVDIPADGAEAKGTITFTPQDEGITEWHWTLTRDGETHTEEGRGLFRPGAPKPASRRRPKKPAAIRRRPVGKKKAGKKTSRSKMKPAGKKKQPRLSRHSKR